MADCPFCEIVKNDEGRVIAEGHHTIVILSNPRLVAGHALVIPKRHVLKLQALSVDEQKELFDTVLVWQEKIIDKLATGCDIRQNNRPFIQQNALKIDHIHIHLIPRESGDELYQKSMQFEKEIFKTPSEEERQDILSMLQK